MSERVSVINAAKELGCAPQSVRENIKSGEWDLGEIIKPIYPGTNYQYHIYRSKLDKHLGKTVRE